VRAVEPLERAGRAFVKNFGLVIARNESTTRDEKKFRKYTLCSNIANVISNSRLQQLLIKLKSYLEDNKLS